MIEDSAKKAPPDFVQTMLEIGLSTPTIKTYIYHFNRFMNYYPQLSLDEITPDHIRSYIIHLVKEKHYSQSAQNNAINAIYPVGF